MATVETYISTTELQQRFNIAQQYSPTFGPFYAVRVLHSYRAEGRPWQKILYFLLFSLPMTAAALALDLLGFLIYAVYLIIKKAIEIVAHLLILAFETVLKKALAVAAVIAGFVGTILLIYYKWDIITNFIKNLF